MKKRVILLSLVCIFLVIIIAVIAAVVFIRKNADENNTNQDLGNASDGTDPYIDLKAKTLKVPDKLKNGVFAEEKKLNLPADLEISLYATGMNAPRYMAFDDKGNIFVTAIGDGKVYLIKDEDNDNVGDGNIVVDSGLKNPHGIDYFEGDLYVGEENQIVVYRGINSDGKYTKKEVLVRNIPAGGHVTRTVVIGPDRKMYVAVGSSCNLCVESEKSRAAISRYNLDGSGGELFADGLRNTVGFIFDPDGRIWGVDNGRDLLDDDLPPEEVNIIEQGKNYGWPYCYGKGINNPEYADKKAFCANESAFPVYEMQAHSAPLSLEYIYKDNNPFNSILNGQILIAFHGSWNRSVPTGYKIVRIDTKDKNSRTIDFITGWLQKNGKPWGRPVDIKAGKDNAVYITDDFAGVIYRVSAPSDNASAGFSM